AEYDNEQPIHEVSVKPFWMGKFTVTQEQWARVAKLSKVQIDLNPDPARFKGANRPVEKVNWHEAIEFCARLSKHTGKQYRLPSEAEWEYACRAGTKTHYHFGDVISAAVANYDARAKYCWNGSPEGEYRKQTTPVGNFPANPWGLYEMHGNVWEWCADPWHESYQNAPTNGRVWDSGNEHHYQNITRNIDYLLKSQHPRVLRGGSWLYNPWNCRSALCGSSIPANRHYSVSFRVSCARPKTF
ncbi:MAG: formylglycine-generating enzyme family protein, partial [Spirulinaceae cyanobacterium]